MKTTSHPSFLDKKFLVLFFLTENRPNQISGFTKQPSKVTSDIVIVIMIITILKTNI